MSLKPEGWASPSLHHEWEWKAQNVFKKTSKARQVGRSIWSAYSQNFPVGKSSSRAWGILSPLPFLRALFSTPWGVLRETEGKATECYLFVCQDVGVREMYKCGMGAGGEDSGKWALGLVCVASTGIRGGGGVWVKWGGG